MRALRLVRGELGGTLELGSCLDQPAEPGQQVSAHAGEQVVAAERRDIEQSVGHYEPGVLREELVDLDGDVAVGILYVASEFDPTASAI